MDALRQVSIEGAGRPPDWSQGAATRPAGSPHSRKTLIGYFNRRCLNTGRDMGIEDRKMGNHRR